MRARTILTGLLLALLVGSAFLFWRYSGNRDSRTIRETAQTLASIQHELAAPASQTDSETVPREFYSLLLKEKRQARDLIRAVLNTEQPNSSSEQLHKAVVRALAAYGVRLADSPGEAPAAQQVFGSLYIQLERVLGQRNLVAAKIGTGLPCGVDSALYIFERDGAIWSPILAYEAPQYNDIKGAYGALDYALSPASDGNWYVLVANVAPACNATWQELHYGILRKGDDLERPKVLLNSTARIYVGWEQLWKLKADADTARITWPSEFKLDGTILIRAHVANFKIAADKVTRVQPVALYPEDFVDEWADSAWEQAKEWVAPEALADAEAVHKWLHQGGYAATVEFLQPCPIPDHWQIGVALEPSASQAPPVPKLYVDVSRDGDIFRLDRIAPDRAPGCPGMEFLPQRPQTLP